MSMKVVFVVHPNQSKRFMFETPVDVKSGDMLCVNTMRGEAMATAVSPSMEISDASVEDFARFHDAYLPLKNVIGRYVLERFDEHEQDDHERKFHERKFKVGDRVRCVKQCCYADVGEVGTVLYYDQKTEHYAVEWDNDVDGHALGAGGAPPCKGGHGEWLKDEHIELVEPQVREVKRKAEVGEYIKIVDKKSSHKPPLNIGDIHLVDEDYSNDDDDDDEIGTDHNNVFSKHQRNEYVVLEGYTDEMYEQYKKEREAK